MATPHGGGKRFETDSEDYQTILDWIRNGAPYSSGDASAEAKLSRLELYPSMAILPVEAEHRLLVTAHFSDGHTEDYTHQALYTVNDGEVAAVSAGGVVSAKRRGETSILVRAAGQVASAGVGVIGPPVARLPEDRRATTSSTNTSSQKLRKFQIVPSDLAGDSEFLRRVCLDLTGTLPPPQRVREFLASTDPRKREKVIDALIASPEFVDYWTFRFADLFRVSIFGNGLSPKWMEEYWEWIRAQHRDQPPLRRGRARAHRRRGLQAAVAPFPAVQPDRNARPTPWPKRFASSWDAASIARSATTIPTKTGARTSSGAWRHSSRACSAWARWWWTIPPNMDLGTKDVGGSMDLLHPRTKAVVKPALLDNSPLTSRPDGNPRKELARWMTSHPYFAEAAVNRIWGYFFARGIVDPVDDFRSTNPPTHPELLAALAADFREHGYDLRRLMKTIVSSRTYQLSHRPNADQSRGRDQLFAIPGARPRCRGAAGRGGRRDRNSRDLLHGHHGRRDGGAGPGGHARDSTARSRHFLLALPGTVRTLQSRRRSGAEQQAEPQPGDARAGRSDLCGPPRPARTAGWRSCSHRAPRDEEIFDEFYLAALSREPAADELQELKTILAQRGDREAGLREFVWALISSREFAENH